MTSKPGSPADAFRRRAMCLICGAAVSLVSMMVAIVSSHAAISLGPFKDKLFAYGKVLESNAGGRFRVIDYDEMRDVNGRDQVPVFRVRRHYVDLSPRSAEKRTTVNSQGRSIAVDETGRIRNARFAVIFIHGRGGDRRLGSSDWTFGGNFNRIKNLAVRNGGLYTAPSVPAFNTAGAGDIAALIEHVSASSPHARIVLSCASMGSFICWRLAHDGKTVGRLAGMMIMGGASDSNFPASAAFKARLPMFFSHGSKDRVYPWRRQKALFDRIRSASADYPTRFVLFKTGKHGTPIRMTDWRMALNWIFAESAAR